MCMKQKIMESITTDQPLVSVCVVTYNDRDYIAQCMESLLIQKTTFKVEFLIHDDASTDGTTEIIKKYEREHPDKFNNVYQEENQFLKQNTLVNILFKNAKGKYIALCHGDDYWTDPAKLQKQIDFLEVNPGFSMCFHNVMIKEEYTDMSLRKGDRLFNPVMKKDVFEFSDVVDGWLANTSSIVFRSSCINTFPDWFNKCMSGEIVIIAFNAAMGNIKYLNFVGSVYRMNDNGVSKNYHGRYLIEGRLFFLNSLNTHFNFKYSRSIKPALAKYYARLIFIELMEGRFLKACSAIVKSIFASPRIFYKQFLLEIKYYSSVARKKMISK
jgi:glycosyltransferase involved in cell wall biosynthesis